MLFPITDNDAIPHSPGKGGLVIWDLIKHYTNVGFGVLFYLVFKLPYIFGKIVFKNKMHRKQSDVKY